MALPLASHASSVEHIPGVGMAHRKGIDEDNEAENWEPLFPRLSRFSRKCFIE